MISRAATLPVLSGSGATLVALPPVSIYAYPPGQGGTTTNRPASPKARDEYYDTDLREPIFYNAGRARWESFTGESRA